MTFAGLTPDINYIRDREKDSQLISKMTDDQLLSEQMTSVMKDFRRDVCRALNLGPYSIDLEETLDEVATEFEYDLRTALTLLQLAYIYGARGFGSAGTMNFEKAKQYRSEYREERKGFSGLTLRATGRQKTRIVMRRF